MQFNTGTATRCSGGSHYQLPVTVNGVERTLHFTADDMGRDFSDLEGAREAVLDRLRSAIKEAGATTLIQIRNAISSKTFHA